MPTFRQFVQCIQNSASQTYELSFLQSHLSSNRICSFKSDPPDIICQPVWILLDNLDTFTSIGLKDSGCMSRTDFMALKKQHDILDLFLFLPAVLDPLHADLPDPFHLDQFVRILFNHIQCILPEFLHDPLCKLWPHTLDQPGTKIFFNTIYSRR